MTEKIYGDGAFRRESLQGSTIENTYAGALSFMRRRYTRDLSEADVVVSGVPLDLATTFRPGARLGPAAIRAASVQLAELNLFPWGFDPFDDLAVIDYGVVGLTRTNRGPYAKPSSSTRWTSFKTAMPKCSPSEATISSPIRCCRRMPKNTANL